VNASAANSGRSTPVSRVSAGLTTVVLAAAASWLLLAGGCATPPAGPPPPKPPVVAAPVVVPARLVSNFFLVETKWGGEGPFRLLIDTGSSATLVSADLAKRFRLKERKPAETVAVRSASGEVATLEAVTLRRLWIGDAVFEQVPARIFDFSDLSHHLGLQIDAAIGFPVFRDVVLTLDYPGSRLVLSPRDLPGAVPAGATIAFNNEQSIPLIPVQLGNESFIVLVDSGSDGALSINPVGLHPRFIAGPRPGPVVASLVGDRRRMVGRVGAPLLIGSFTVDQPVADLTDDLSAVGGELLRHFVLTFDQKRNQVTFARTDGEPVRLAARRSTGLSFARSPAYWRVLSVVPDTPALQLGVQAGDLCVRVNGEVVEAWPLARYEQLLRSATSVTYTFLAGTHEIRLEVPVIDLVP
jgi:hypothetical protein